MAETDPPPKMDEGKPSPLQLPYIITLKSFLRLPGAWPSEVFGEKLPLPILAHRVTMPFHSMMIFVGGLYYLYQNHDHLRFLDMGHVLITACLAMITSFRSTLLNTKKFNQVLLRFMNDFHLLHFRNVDPYYEKMHIMIDKISHIYTRFGAAAMYVMTIMFNASPAYHNVKNKVFLKTENYSMEYTVYIQYPGFNPLKYAISTSLYNVYCSFTCAIVLCGCDLLMFLMIFQIIGHVLILRHNLESFEPPKNIIQFGITDKASDQNSCTYEVFDAEENKMIHTKLVQCVEHHKIIIDFTDELSEIFGPMLAFNYLFHMFSCCLLLLECSQASLDAILRYGPLTAVVFGQLFQMSIIFELLGAETEKLKDSIYCSPWECMDVPNQRTVDIVLHKMQDKISLKAMGLAAVGVNTMTAILKATFSYYAFLTSVGNDNFS